MSNPELITNIVAKKEGTSVFDISSTDIEGFNDYFTAVVNEFRNHHQIPKEDSPVNVANYLIYVFAKVETCKIRDNDDQNDIHSAMEDTVKRIRGHVYRGTFSQSHAAKMFMPLMQDLLEAYDRYANTLEDMDCEVLWFELLDLPQRYELCDLLLEGLGGYIHNYRSSRRDD